jgi:hypothetical protein
MGAIEDLGDRRLLDDSGNESKPAAALCTRKRVSASWATSRHRMSNESPIPWRNETPTASIGMFGMSATR